MLGLGMVFHFWQSICTGAVVMVVWSTGVRGESVVPRVYANSALGY